MADERYWTYRSAFRTPEFAELPEGVFRGSERDWHSLSPGMRREIFRSWTRHNVLPLPPY